MSIQGRKGSATRSGVNPNFVSSCFSGAEAPNVCMPSTKPSRLLALAARTAAAPIVGGPVKGIPCTRPRCQDRRRNLPLVLAAAPPVLGARVFST